MRLRARGRGRSGGARGPDARAWIVSFKNYCGQKNQIWRTYLRSEFQAAAPILPAESVRNRVRYSCCSIC